GPTIPCRRAPYYTPARAPRATEKPASGSGIILLPAHAACPRAAPGWLVSAALRTPWHGGPAPTVPLRAAGGQAGATRWASALWRVSDPRPGSPGKAPGRPQGRSGAPGAFGPSRPVRA